MNVSAMTPVYSANYQTAFKGEEAPAAPEMQEEDKGSTWKKWAIAGACITAAVVGGFYVKKKFFPSYKDLKASHKSAVEALKKAKSDNVTGDKLKSLEEAVKTTREARVKALTEQKKNLLIKQASKKNITLSPEDAEKKAKAFMDALPKRAEAFKKNSDETASLMKQLIDKGKTKEEINKLLYGGSTLDEISQNFKKGDKFTPAKDILQQELNKSSGVPAGASVNAGAVSGAELENISQSAAPEAQTVSKNTAAAYSKQTTDALKREEEELQALLKKNNAAPQAESHKLAQQARELLALNPNIKLADLKGKSSSEIASMLDAAKKAASPAKPDTPHALKKLRERIQKAQPAITDNALQGKSAAELQSILAAIKGVK